SRLDARTLGPDRQGHRRAQLGVTNLVGDHPGQATEQLELDAGGGQDLGELTELLNRAVLVAGSTGPLDRCGSPLRGRPGPGVEAGKVGPGIAVDLLAMN